MISKEAFQDRGASLPNNQRLRTTGFVRQLAYSDQLRSSTEFPSLHSGPLYGAN